MKQILFSFLFLCLGLSSCFSQQAQDSLYFYQNKVLYPKNATDVFQSYKFFNERLKKAELKSDIPSQLNSMYYLSSINYKLGAYDESEQISVKAIGVLNKHSTIPNRIHYQKSFYNLLGMLYYEQQNKKKSLSLYNKVLELSVNAKDSAIVYNNISNTYKKHNDFNEAKQALSKAYDLTKRIDDTLTIALVMDNLGFINSKLSNADEGLRLMKQAIKMRSFVKDTVSKYKSYTHLAQYYFNTGNSSLAKENALKAFEIAEKIKSASYRQDALGLLITLSEDPYVTQYKKVNDSINKAEKETKNKFALLKYDYSNFEKKLLLSQLQEQKQKSKTVIASLVAIGVVLLSLILYVFLKAKHNKDKLLQVVETESRISNQVHDEIANEVFQVMIKFDNQEENSQKSKLIKELNNLYYKARDISKQHSVIDVKNSFEDSLIELMNSYNDTDTNVIIKGVKDIVWKGYSEINKITVYKVLQELLINMKKHSKASLVVVSFLETKGKLEIKYSDNGVGCTIKKGNGLENTENRIQAINGTITFESKENKGFKAIINIS